MRISAGALFFNNKNELLMIKPNYRDRWSLPGGVVEKGESPRDGCLREIKEEIGLEIDLNSLRLAGVVYVHQKELDDESLQLVFQGSTLNKNQISKINLGEDEIEDYKFVSLKDLPKYNNEMGSKLKAYLKSDRKNNSIAYFEKHR